MCFFGGSQAPEVIETAPAPTETNETADTERSEAGIRRMRAAANSGRSSTIANLGGASGLSNDPNNIFQSKLS